MVGGERAQVEVKMELTQNEKRSSPQSRQMALVRPVEFVETKKKMEMVVHAPVMKLLNAGNTTTHRQTSHQWMAVVILEFVILFLD